MKRIFLLIIIYYSLLITNSLSQWVIQNSGTTSHLYDVFFINTNTGWACGASGTILKTINGGNNWFGQISGTTFSLESIHFVNSDIGYCIIRGTSINKTTNGGNNWFVVLFSPKLSRSIYFIDSLRGWALGTYGGGWVFRTTNGGTSWDSVMVAGGSEGHVFFLNTQTGWVSTGPFIFKSTDGGINWTLLFDTGGGTIAEFSFVNQNTGWLVTRSWTVYKTTNSGNNWSILDTLPGYVGSHSIYFSSLNTGWISGDGGYMFKTTDGGLKWGRQNTNTTSFLSSVFFLTDSIGYSVGGGGRIIFTSSSGSVLPVKNIHYKVPEYYELYQNYPNPFNPNTYINFDIPDISHINLSVYDNLGRLVSVLVDGKLTKGSYSIEFNGENLSSGVYYYRLIAGKFTDIKKMILIK